VGVRVATNSPTWRHSGDTAAAKGAELWPCSRFCEIACPARWPGRGCDQQPRPLVNPDQQLGKPSGAPSPRWPPSHRRDVVGKRQPRQCVLRAGSLRTLKSFRVAPPVRKRIGPKPVGPQTATNRSTPVNLTRLTATAIKTLLADDVEQRGQTDEPASARLARACGCLPHP
jgi:hypothetical protein